VSPNTVLAAQDEAADELTLLDLTPLFAAMRNSFSADWLGDAVVRSTPRPAFKRPDRDERT